MTPDTLAHDLLCLDLALQRIAADMEAASQRLRALMQRIGEPDAARMRLTITGENLPPVERPEGWREP